MCIFTPLTFSLTDCLFLRQFHIKAKHSLSPFCQENKEPPAGQFSAGNTLGVEVFKVHRRFSGNLQLPPLSWRQAEKERERGRPLTPEEDPVTHSRPTSLPIASLPRIDITQADPDRWGCDKHTDTLKRFIRRHQCCARLGKFFFHVLLCVCAFVVLQ